VGANRAVFRSDDTLAFNVQGNKEAMRGQELDQDEMSQIRRSSLSFRGRRGVGLFLLLAKEKRRMRLKETAKCPLKACRDNSGDEGRKYK
jgi:hypothetical protein